MSQQSILQREAWRRITIVFAQFKLAGAQFDTYIYILKAFMRIACCTTESGW